MRALPPARLLGLLLGLTVLPVAAAPDRAALCAAQGAGGVPADLVARLARGFNLTGWIEGDRPMPPDPALLGRLRARGLSHVRLPFDGERLMPAFGTRARRAEGLARLDAALRQLLDAGFTVSLDMHPGEGFAALHRAEPERALAMLDAAWAVLARRYAALAPDRLLFEVLNEPPNAEAWTGQMPRAVAALRVHAPGRILVVAPGGPQRVEALAALAPLADPRLVYAVHFYDPMAFTHQGNDWGGADDPLRFLGGLPFPAAAEDRPCGPSRPASPARGAAPPPPNSPPRSGSPGPRRRSTASSPPSATGSRAIAARDRQRVRRPRHRVPARPRPLARGRPGGGRAPLHRLDPLGLRRRLRLRRAPRGARAAGGAPPRRPHPSEGRGPRALRPLREGTVMDDPLSFIDAIIRRVSAGNLLAAGLLLATAFLCALIAYLRTAERYSLRAFFEFAIPHEVIVHPSARADLLFWVTRRALMPFLMLPAGITFVVAVGYATNRGSVRSSASTSRSSANPAP